MYIFVMILLQKTVEIEGLFCDYLSFGNKT
jgi:hypothetical protein